MSSKQYLAKLVFLHAVEIPAEDERYAYLDAECKDDKSLRCEVEELLQLHQGLGSFMEAPSSPHLERIDQPVEVCNGTVIGPYRLLQQIGEGGMGAVYMAEQEQPVCRKVALKVIKPGMDSDK